MPNPIDNIDIAAKEVARSVEVLVYAIEGLCDEQIKDNPTVQGLNTFISTSLNMAETTLNTVVDKVMTEIEGVLEASLSDSELAFYDERTDSAQYALIVREAFWGAFQQARSFYARRARAAVIANSGDMGPNTLPNIRTRDGSKRNFKEYMYLVGRGLMISYYNEVKIAYMVHHGYTKFTLNTQDAELINKVYDVVDYPIMAQELFHPRVNKLVGDYYVST